MANQELGRGREQVLREAGTFLFLCSGNMVRSAFAELYARHLGFPRIVRSAATRFRNDGIYPEAGRALLARGVSADSIRRFQPTHVADIEARELKDVVFLGMRYHHLEALPGIRGLGRSPQAGDLAERSLLLIDGEEIADPVLEGADFHRTFERVAFGVELLIETLGRG